MFAWDEDINNPPTTLKGWARLIIRRPALLRRYIHWRKSIKFPTSTLEDPYPFIVYEAIDWLESYLTPKMKVFEWGSGRSTIYFARQGCEVISVEHDADWYFKITEALHRDHLNNVTLLLREPEKASPNCEMYASIDERYAGLQFARYARSIDAYPDHLFDLVIVDGRARPACMLHALPKIRPGGYLLLDDSTRRRYAIGREAVRGWPQQQFVGPVPTERRWSSTTVWQKPASDGAGDGASRELPTTPRHPDVPNEFQHEYDLDSLVLIHPPERAFEMEVTPRFVQYYGREKHEGFTADLLANVLHSHRLFIDIGAHHGFYTLLAASRHPQLEILAFEPVPENYAILCRNIARYGWEHIRTSSAAVSNQKGRAGFHVSSASDCSGFYSHALASSLRILEVETVTIDALLADRDPCRTCIKVDTEGHELDILDGMSDTLSRFPELSLVMELNPKMLARAGRSPEEFLETVGTLGFDIFFLDDKVGLAAKASGVQDWQQFVASDRYVNVYCVRRARSLSICLFSHSAELGGAERSLLELVTELIQDHGCVCTAVLPAKGPLAQLLSRVGAGCIIAPYRWWCDIIALPAEEYARRMRESLVSLLGPPLHTLKTINPDIVVTFSMTIPWGAVGASLLKKPHVWHPCEYGDENAHLHFFYPFDRVLEIIRTCSSGLFTPTITLRNSFFPGVSDDNWTYLHRHITIPAEAPGKPPMIFYSRPEALHLGVFATLWRGKGQEDAVRAAAELIHQGHDVELLLAGQQIPEYLERLETLSKNLGIGDHVRFVGFLPDVYPAMRQTDVTVICSRSEAFGRVALEGMLLGKPVLYPDLDTFRELMVDGETGLSYVPGDWLHLAHRIHTLLKDPGLRASLGKQGRSYASARFTRKQFGGKAFDFLLKKKTVKSPPLHDLLQSAIGTSLADIAHTYQALVDETARIVNENASQRALLNEFVSIQKTLGWRLLTAYWHAVDVALRPDTRRRRAYDAGFGLLNSLISGQKTSASGREHGTK